MFNGPVGASHLKKSRNCNGSIYLVNQGNDPAAALSWSYGPVAQSITASSQIPAVNHGEIARRGACPNQRIFITIPGARTNAKGVTTRPKEKAGFGTKRPPSNLPSHSPAAASSADAYNGSNAAGYSLRRTHVRSLNGIVNLKNRASIG